jgi:hypothetical protein
MKESEGSAEAIKKLEVELEKALGPKSGWWFTKSVGVTSDIGIGLKKPRRYDTNQKRESWQKQFGEGVAIKYGVRFVCVIDECRGLVSATFSWDASEIHDADRCVAAIKDFVAGIEAGKKIDVDEAINAARLSAALKAAISSGKKTERGDRGDLL